MSWTTDYNKEDDVTIIKYNQSEIGRVDGRIAKSNGLPIEGRDIIKSHVNNPEIVDLIYGFD